MKKLSRDSKTVGRHLAFSHLFVLAQDVNDWYFLTLLLFALQRFLHYVTLW